MRVTFLLAVLTIGAASAAEVADGTGNQQESICYKKPMPKVRQPLKSPKQTKKGTFTVTVKYAGSKYCNVKIVNAEITVKLWDFITVSYFYLINARIP